MLFLEDGKQVPYEGTVVGTRRDRTHVREFPAAPSHFHEQAAVVMTVGLEIDSADDGKKVHPLGGVRQKFATVHSRHRSGDGSKWSAVTGSRLRIPTLQLADSPLEVDLQNSFLLPFQFF